MLGPGEWFGEQRHRASGELRRRPLEMESTFLRKWPVSCDEREWERRMCPCLDEDSSRKREQRVPRSGGRMLEDYHEGGIAGVQEVRGRVRSEK